MSDPKVRGFNHLTLAVADIDRSIRFYRDVLGCELRALWAHGAYLEAGALWLCLSRDPAATKMQRADYTHYAFDAAPETFEDLCAKICREATIWKDNRSEGASLYFLDPDGHRLELHVGTLASRLARYRADASAGVTVL